MTYGPGFETGGSEAQDQRLVELLDRLELQEGGAFPVVQEVSAAPVGKPLPTRRSSMILALRIPEAPYSDEALERLHKFFDVIEGVHATLEILGVEVASLLGVGVAGLLAVGGPIAGLLGVFMALGAGYAQARAEVAKSRVKMGFAKGVVTGADGTKWSFAKSLFWERIPEANTFDPQAGRIGQQAFNLGLVSGFVQGRKLSAKQREFLWRSIGRTLTEGDRKYYTGPRASWPKRLWLDWYTNAAAKFLMLYVRD